MDHLGLSIGDTVEARKDVDMPPIDLTVVGSAVVPDDSGTVGNAVLTPDGLERVGHDDIQTTAVAPLSRRCRPRGARTDSSSDDYGLSFPLFAHAQLPGPVTNVEPGPRSRHRLRCLLRRSRRRRPLPCLHAVDAAAPIRTSRCCGRWASAGARYASRSSAQAVTIGIVGLVIGVPVGLIVGRGFSAPADRRHRRDHWASTPWLLIGIVVPAALLAAAVVSLWPARSAAHAPTIRILQDD